VPDLTFKARLVFVGAALVLAAIAGTVLILAGPGVDPAARASLLTLWAGGLTATTVWAFSRLAKDKEPPHV